MVLRRRAGRLRGDGTGGEEERHAGKERHRRADRLPERGAAWLFHDSVHSSASSERVRPSKLTMPVTFSWTRPWESIRKVSGTP